MQACLYDPDDGFYATGGTAGRRGDFLTSPEVGPLFGAVLARALDRWWDELARPAPYLVVEAGAGPGTLARAVLAAAPRCAPALRYVLVEVSAAQRARHGEGLPLEPPSSAGLGPEPDPDGPARTPVAGPIVVSLAAMPAVAAHVLVANELLDNLPFDVLVERDGRWEEARVGDDGDRFAEVLVPAAVDLAVLPGARVPVAVAARAWVADALARLVPGGRLLVFDYAATTAEIAARRAPVPRTYRGHERGLDPLEAPGTCDITADVPVDQLPTPGSVCTQAEFLREHGIDELVAEGRRVWAERAGIGDLTALRARSRIAESEALTDPDGLGAFAALQWVH